MRRAWITTTRSAWAARLGATTAPCVALGLGVFIAACAATSELPVRAKRTSGALVSALADGPPAVRSLQARTSLATAFAPCREPDSLPLPARCPNPRPPDERTLRLAARAAAAIRDSATADALHASALIDLHWGDPSGKSLARSLQSLGQVARYEGSSASWADLAAAELARADVEQEPRARLAALDAAVHAVHADSTNPVSRFNLALAAERLGLDGRAREEWMRYLEIDGTSGWSDEARKRIGSIQRRAVPSARGVLDSATIASLAARDPTALRMRMLTNELGEWSGATRDNSPARAAAVLAVMRSAGAALASRYGDGTVNDVVAELSANAMPNDIVVAEAFAAGQVAAQEGRYAAAESLFALAAAARRSPTIAAWGRTYEAIQQVYTGRLRQATAGLERAMSEARTNNQPALEARAGWTRAVLHFRSGRRDEADAILRRVTELSRRLGDREAIAVADEMRGEDRYAAGDERAAWRLVMGAMSTLRGYRSSLRLRSALNLLAWAADERGLSGAAAFIRDEDAAVALASGHEDFHAEALLAAARSRLSSGDTARALATLRGVDRTIASLPASDESRWLSARAAQLRAAAGVPVSRGALDSAVAFFGQQRNGVLLVDVLLTRARALIASDGSRAQRDLDSALAIVKARAAQYGSSAERRAMERRIHDIGASAALAHLARHDDARALAAIERGRMSAIPASLERDAVVIDYLLVGDTLIAWRMAGGRTTTTRDVVSARAIRFARERIVQSAEAGAVDQGSLVVLYDLLLRRHRAALRETTQLVVVADDEVAGIPFTALRDTVGAGERVVDRMSVRVVPRLIDAVPSLPASPISRALFVSDPAFDRTVFRGLSPLPGARSEVDASRRFYASPVTLAGGAATTTAVRSAMRGVELVHFASHARFDPEHPEQSRLVLAPDAETSDGLPARTISGMQLTGVRLAVLSSCESMQSGIADAPLTVGLAKAFHDAGVPAVVGALWKVDDEATATLMAEFHRQYSTTRDPARALRDAQLALLRGSNAGWRDPATWGAFIVTGR